MSYGSLSVVPAEFPITFTVPPNFQGETLEVQRVRTPLEEFAHTVTESLLRTLVPLIASDTTKPIAPSLLKYLPAHRRKRGNTMIKTCREYLVHARSYYRTVDGEPTSEIDSFEYAFRPLNEIFGRTRITEFGPLKLTAVREKMIGKGWCRKYVNEQVGRIKRMVKWAVANEIAPPSIHHGMQAVSGLRMGRSAAPESPPVKPALESSIQAVMARVSSPIRAMMEIQLLTGMRPGELCRMRACEIDQTENPWVYRPRQHKTRHHNHERVIFLGPKTQAVIRPFLNANDPEAYLFSPKAAMAERFALAHAKRVTPLSCGNVPGSNKKRRPKRAPGDQYKPLAYSRAVYRGCELAFPTPEGLTKEQQKAWRKKNYWHPNQLRHNAATRLRKQYGLDIAQVILGHKTLSVTQVYAEKDVASAQKVMGEVG